MGMGVVERGNVEMGRLIVTYREEMHLENNFGQEYHAACVTDHRKGGGGTYGLIRLGIQVREGAATKSCKNAQYISFILELRIS